MWGNTTHDSDLASDWTTFESQLIKLTSCNPCWLPHEVPFEEISNCWTERPCEGLNDLATGSLLLHRRERDVALDHYWIETQHYSGVALVFPASERQQVIKKHPSRRPPVVTLSCHVGHFLFPFILVFLFWGSCSTARHIFEPFEPTDSYSSEGVWGRHCAEAYGHLLTRDKKRPRELQEGGHGAAIWAC